MIGVFLLSIVELIFVSHHSLDSGVEVLELSHILVVALLRHFLPLLEEVSH